MRNIAFLDQLKDLLSPSCKRRMALVCSNDMHCLEGIVRAKRDGVINPVLLGPASETEDILRSLGEDPASFELHDAVGAEDCAKMAARMVNEGSVDGIMKGRLQTAELMKVLINKEYGIRSGDVISGIGLFEISNRGKAVLVSDMAMVMSPTLEQKKAIIENAVRVMQRIGVDIPKVAVLSAAEKPSPKMPGSMDADSLKKMNEAGEIPGCIIEGPISYDLAVSRSSAEVKGYSGKIQGDADILIAPDITAANILAKCLGVTVG